MEITLEKIELVREKTGVTYKEAKAFLEETDGDVLEAIIAIEDEIDRENTDTENFVSGVVKKVKDLIKRGNVSKIAISKNGDTLVNIPVNVGIVGAVVAPSAVVAATIATFGLRCKVEVVLNDGRRVDVSGRAGILYKDTLEKGKAAFEYAKEKAPEAWGFAKEETEKAWNFAKEKSEEITEKAKESVSQAFNRNDDSDL